MAGDKKPPRRQRADSVDSVLSDLQSARRKVLGKKEIPPDHEALVRNNEKLQKELLEVRAANRKLEKEKEDLNIECNELSEEKGERDGNTKGYKEEVLDLKVKLQAARETAGEDRARAERAEKELDEIWSSIAHKRREAEERIVISKADREELEERRRVWNHPGTQALLSGRAEIARHWENNEEKEKQMVMDFVKSRQNARTPKSNMKTWKKPSPDDANDNEAIMEKLQQRLAERENEFAALEAKFEKVNNAEREPNTDDAVSDLRPQLDEAHEKIETLEKEIKTLEKEISASNQAREEASAAMERLKKKIRKVGKWPGQGSAFSMPVSGSTSSEQGGVSSEAGTNSEATAHSLAEELARCEDGPDDNVSLVSWRGDYSSGEEDDQVLETDRPREAARIRDLEELVVSQLEFHRDVEPHLALTRDQFMEFRAFHADIFKKLGVSDEAEPEVEAVKVEASRAAVDDAKEVIRQVLGRVVGARGEKMRGNWVPMQKANMRLRLVVGEAREVLKENALRLGIKIPEPHTTWVEEVAASIDTRLSSVLDTLGHPLLFTILLYFINAHLAPYRRLAALLYATILYFTGAPPQRFPRLHALDVPRILSHVVILLTVQTYLALSKERDLWLHANAAHTTAYLHDLQGEMSCVSCWGVDPRLMTLGTEMFDMAKAVLPEHSGYSFSV